MGEAAFVRSKVASFFLFIIYREIELRLDAVEELRDAPPPILTDFLAVVAKLPDLERGICRVYYKKCTIKEFIVVINAFKLFVLSYSIDNAIGFNPTNLLPQLSHQIFSEEFSHSFPTSKMISSTLKRDASFIIGTISAR